MKRFVFLSWFCLAISLGLLSDQAFAQCGVERWAVKTGTDTDASLLDLNSKSNTTVSNLTAVAAPSPIPDSNRVQPTETTIWVLNATLKKYVRAYDSDYHMVLADDAGHTMIAEIPDPGCVGPGSPLADGIAHARAQFDAVFSATTNFQDADVPVRITGVGFFDYLEGQEGVAPNGVELHPVIDIIFNPYFTVSASPAALTILQGGSGTINVSSALSGAFNSSVSFSASGLPPGATASFSPPSIAAPGAGSSLMTINLDPTVPIGNYSVVVSGTGGGQTHSTTITLTVTDTITQQLLGNTGFENGSANPSPWTATTAVIDNSTFETPHTGSWKAWLDGYGSAHTDTIQQQVALSANTTQATLSFWLHIDTAETANLANDTLKVQVRNSSGVVLSTLATYSNLNAASGYRQVSFDLSSYKGQTIQIYLIGVENSKLKTSFVVDDFALNATTTVTADFNISAAPANLTIAQGGANTSSITTTTVGSFNASIGLTATGVPSGTTASFNPVSIAAPGSGSTNLSFNVGSSTVPGTYNISVTGTGGGKTHSTTIALTVVSSGGTTQQLLGNPGFENGSSNPSPWTVTAGVIDNNSTSEPPHGGTWKAWLDGYGSTHTDTLMQQVAIPANATQATLSLWLHIDTAETTTSTAYDTLKIQLRNSSGAVLGTLGSYSNLNAKSGYSQLSFDLGTYKGQTIQVYLVGVEDSSLRTSFVVDDFALNVTTP